jgi:hypothetical protein
LKFEEKLVLARLNPFLRSPDSEESKGKVVRFDPTLRRDPKKPGPRKGNSKKINGFGANRQNQATDSPIRFKVYKVIQIIVVALAFAYMMKSCVFR